MNAKHEQCDDLDRAVIPIMKPLPALLGASLLLAVSAVVATAQLIVPCLEEQDQPGGKLSIGSEESPAAAGGRRTLSFDQPPFPRPPVRPHGCSRGLPPKANS